jgi:NAD(P)-dependent dehydrogenase (short-subunit alcohol dehydrogenase family)
MDESNVVVTGASRGIGEHVVRRFAAEGARVTCCARSRDDLDDVVESAEGTVVSVRADVRDEFDVERLMETAAEAGDVDVVVANAAVNHGPAGERPLQEESYARFDDTIRTNLRGVFTTVRESLPHLAPDARILVPSGSVARESTPGMGAYAVSKACAESSATVRSSGRS